MKKWQSQPEGKTWKALPEKTKKDIIQNVPSGTLIERTDIQVGSLRAVIWDRPYGFTVDIFSGFITRGHIDLSNVFMKKDGKNIGKVSHRTAENKREHIDKIIKILQEVKEQLQDG